MNEPAWTCSICHTTWHGLHGWGVELNPCCEEDYQKAMRQELDRLYAESEARRKEDGGVWPEYEGPGR